MKSDEESVYLLSGEDTKSTLKADENKAPTKRDLVKQGEHSQSTKIVSESKENLSQKYNMSKILEFFKPSSQEYEAIDGNDDLTTVFETYWNICNTIQGLPMLAIPYAFKSGGWVSLALLLIIATVSNYTSKILVESLYRYENGYRIRVRSSYMDIGEAFWKKGGKWLVMVMMVVELVFVSTLYPVLVANMIQKSFPSLNVPAWGLTFIGGIFLLPNTLLKNLSQVAWTSIITICSAIIIFFCVVGYSFSEVSKWDIGNMNNFDLHQFPAGVSIIISCHLTQPFVPFIESTMKIPKRFNFALNWAFISMTIFSLLISLIASLAFYPHTDKVITNNLPEGAFRQVINAVAAILAFTSYTLPIFTCFDIIENAELPCLPAEFGDNIYKIPVQLIRLTLVMVTILMAAFIPYYDDILALVGSITGVSLVFTFPALFHMKIYWYELKWFQLALDTFIVFIGTLSMLISLVVSWRSMYSCYAYNLC